MTVIGAGIVGVCAGLALLRDGHEVTIVDRDGPGENCSFGNAGIICTTDSSVPLPSPGIIRDVPGMLLDRRRYLMIRMSYLPRFMPWLLGFLRSASGARQAAGARAFYRLLDGTVAAYEKMTDGTPAKALLRRNGYMTVYETDRGFDEDGGERRVLRELGCMVEELGPDEVRQMEPALAHSVRHATYYPEAGSTVDPFRLTQLLAEAFAAEGGRLVQAEVRGMDHGGGRVTSLDTSAGRLPVDRLVVAAGAWSGRIARMMGLRLLIDTERGYHAVFHGIETGLGRAVIHGEGHYGLNQLAMGVRFAGTVEFAGIDAPPDYGRARLIAEKGRHILRDFDPGAAGEVSQWMGRRPTMPDYLPALGPATGLSNVWFDCGHQHVGLSLAARCGYVVADLVAGRDPGLDLAPFRPDRF